MCSKLHLGDINCIYMDIKLKKWGIILEPLAENMSCTSTLHRNLFHLNDGKTVDEA